MSGGLRTRRTSPFVAVPSSTVKDRRLSFKALGILAYLLDKPAGWDVRSESLAGERDKDGREAVLSGLRELACHGYYRLERRRLLSGKFAMGTAISEEPVPEWVEDYEAYGGKPVPLVQQSDGTFKVLRPDGSLVDDGFPAPTEDVSAGQTGDGFSGSGETESGPPEPGFTGSGQPVAKVRTEDTDRDTETDSSLRSESALDPADDVGEQQTLDGMEAGQSQGGSPALRVVDEQAAEQSVEELGAAVARWWWDQLDPKPVTGSKRSTGWFPILNTVTGAVRAGWSQREVAEALQRLGQAVPSVKGLDAELRRTRSGQPQPRSYGQPNATDRLAASRALVERLRAEEEAEEAGDARAEQWTTERVVRGEVVR